MAFCKEYNAATAKMGGDIIPVEITVYEVGRGAGAGSLPGRPSGGAACSAAAGASRRACSRVGWDGQRRRPRSQGRAAGG